MVQESLCCNQLYENASHLLFSFQILCQMWTAAKMPIFSVTFPSDTNKRRLVLAMSQFHKAIANSNFFSENRGFRRHQHNFSSTFFPQCLTGSFDFSSIRLSLGIEPMLEIQPKFEHINVTLESFESILLTPNP